MPGDSGASPERPDSLWQQPHRPPWRVSHPRARLTSSSGQCTAVGATLTVTPFLALLFPKWPIFSAGYGHPRASVFLPSRATAPCSLQSSGSICRPCPLTLLSVTFFGRSAFPQRSASCVLQPGICLGFLDSLTPRCWNPCPVLLFVL